MIKHISGPMLIRSKQVWCFAKPGAKVDDIYLHAKEQIKHHRPSALVLHFGTNSTQDNADNAFNKIVSVAETLESETGSHVTISGIIHHHTETNEERRKVTTTNQLLKEFTG